MVAPIACAVFAALLTAPAVSDGGQSCPTGGKATRTCPATFNVHSHSDVGPDGSTCPSAFNASGIVPECTYDVCHFQLGAGEGAQQCGASCCGNDNCSFFVVTPFIKYSSPVCHGKASCTDPKGLCCWLKGGASTFISGGYTSGSVYTAVQPPPPCPPGKIFLTGPKFIERPTGVDRSHASYQAHVLDLDGKPIADPQRVSWSVPGNMAGVSIHQGHLTVRSTLAADTAINVTASIGNFAATMRVAVAALKPTAVTITGPAAINLGTVASQTHAYTAVVVDQLGRPLVVSGSSINWTLASAEQIDPTIKPKMTKPPPAGVSINSETGVLTVVQSADRGDFSVRARLVGVAADVHGAVFVAGDAFDAVAFLATEDTATTVTVGGVLPGGPMRMRSLRHRTAGWEWICDDGVEVPLPSPRGSSATWHFVNATQNSTAVSFVFTAADLQLTSMWIARAGGGPVENMVQITNLGGTPAVFDSSLQSASMKLMTPANSVFSMFEKRGVGTPLPPMNILLQDQLSLSIPTGGPGRGTEEEGQYIPLAYIKVEGSHYSDTVHGLFVGSEWELGHLNVTTTASGDEVDTFLVVAPIDPANATKHLQADFVTIAAGAQDPEIQSSFSVPAVYYGVFQGRQDDGSNTFKQWFWRHKITRSLHDNDDEPWVQQCWEPAGGAPFPGARKGIPGAGVLPQSLYNATAATGVECLKVDVGWYDDRNWTWRPADWPHGFDYKQKAHVAGMKTSLYMGGTYHDVNLSTVAGRDIELKAVLERYDENYMDMWRTDKYTAPDNPLPDSFAGVTNFLHIMDTLISSRPGFRYEGCANGGHFKGLALARRLTFTTTNDAASDVTMYRQTHWINTHVHNPLQLKCDTAFWDPAAHSLEFFLRSCFLGSWLVCPPDSINSTHNQVYSEHIGLYKSKQRPILRGGNQYHILPFPDTQNYDGMQYYNEELGRGSVLLFKPSAAAPDNVTVYLRGLHRQTNYQLSHQERPRLDKVATGAALMDYGLTVSGMSGAEASEIVWIDAKG